MKARHIFAILTLGILLISCSDKSFYNDKDYLLIETRVSSISEKGTLLKGILLSEGNDTILELGFALQDPRDSSWTRMAINEIDDKFAYFLDHDIKQGQTYSVKAYGITKDLISYGNVVTFESEGYDTGKPVVSRMFPAQVAEDYSVNIEGENFSILPSNMQISITNYPEQVTILQASKNRITFQVPPLESGLKTVKMQINSSEFLLSSLEVMPPQIEEIYPDSGFDNSEISIKGKYFGNPKIVSFSGTKGKILSKSDSLVTAMVPYSALIGEVEVSLTNASGKATSNQKFNILHPSISSFSPTKGKTGSEVTLKGRNLVIEERSSDILVSGVLCSILNQSAEEIDFLIPDLGNEGDYAYPLIVKNGLKEVPAGILEVLPSWEEIKNVPVNPLDDPVGIALNGKAYFGIGGTSTSYYHQPSPEWWSYEPGNDEWNRLADFPGSPSFGSLSFTNGNSIYIALGLPAVGGTSYPFHVWEYNTDQDSWTQKKDFPFQESNIQYYSSVVYEDKIYILANNYLYEYDPERDSWKRVSRFYYYNDHIIHQPIAHIYNNRLLWIVPYTMNYGGSYIKIFEYHPSTNTWDELETISTGKYDPREQFSFSIGNKLYFGSGRPPYSTGPLNNKVWELNPLTMTLTRMEHIPESSCRRAAVVIDNKAYVGFGTKEDYEPAKSLFVFDPL